MLDPASQAEGSKFSVYHSELYHFTGGTPRGSVFFCPNFHVIEHYNRADAYVLAVGHLGDRIIGGGPILTPWPRDLRALTRDEGMDLQHRPTQAGFDTGGADGRIGLRTQSAIRAYQTAMRLVPDGFPSAEVLDLLRGKSRKP